MIGVEKKGAIRYWAKSNSKKDGDVALQLLLIYCIYCIHPLCNFRTPTWLSRCWQFDLLRHVFAGLTYQSKRCNKKYCASPYWDVRHVWCRVMNCVCAWTLRPMPIWRMPMYASSVQVCQLYHVISLMYTYVTSVISGNLSCQQKAKETGWNAVGHVSKITANEEVALELRGPQQVRFIQPVMPTRPTLYMHQPVGWPMGYQPRLPSGVCHWLKEKKHSFAKRNI